MKTSFWIRKIGIICIFFGVLGILIGLLQIAVSDLPVMGSGELAKKNPTSLNAFPQLGYICVFVNTIYLLSGVFYLIKKSFSIKLIYTALILSLIFGVISLAITINNPNSYESDRIFKLLGIALDITLLFGVRKLSATYYNSMEEYNTSNIKHGPWAILTPGILKIFSFLGLLFLFIPISLQLKWAFAFQNAANHANSLAIFESYIPEFILGSISFISISFSFLSIILSGIGLKLPGANWLAMNIATLILASILLFLNLFQMM